MLSEVPLVMPLNEIFQEMNKTEIGFLTGHKHVSFSAKLRTGAIALSLILPTSAWAEESTPTKTLSGTLEGQATVLKDEAAKLDQSMRSFSLHADTYNQSKIHRLVAEHQSSAKTLRARAHSTPLSSKISAQKLKASAPSNPASKLVEQTPKMTSAQLQARIDTVHKLHEEFEAHVTQLKGLVDQYHNFYDLYAAHYDQFKGQLQNYKLESQRAELDLSTPKFNLGATKQAANLAGAEHQLANVLKKMVTLEEESPHLAETYLCPAYDDLQQEFVVALAGLTASIQAFPADQVKVVAQTELQQVEVLKREMEDADRLHEEQLRLQTEYVNIQKNYALIYAKHAQLAKEASSDDKRVETVETMIDKMPAGLSIDATKLNDQKTDTAPTAESSSPTSKIQDRQTQSAPDQPAPSRP